MGKARSFRLTAENETRMEELIKRMRMDNANLTFNKILENYSEFEKYKPVIDNFKSLIEELKKL